MEDNRGYIRLLEDSGVVNPTSYEADDNDLEFIFQLFSGEFNTRDKSPAVLNKAVVRDFETAISYFELHKEINFSDIELESQAYSYETLELVKVYWQSRCRLLRRPLLRTNWKVVNTTPLYGEVDERRIAFKSRETRKRAVRPSRRQPLEEHLTVYTEFRDDHELFMKICQLTLQREKLKYHELLLEASAVVNPTVVGGIEQALVDSKRVHEEAAEIVHGHYNADKVEVDEKTCSESTPELNYVDNDEACFIATLLKEMAVIGLEFDDFKAANIKTQLNEKIRELKRVKSTSTPVSNERTIQLCAPKAPGATFDPSKYIIFNRLLYNSYNDVYIEKTTAEKLDDAADKYDKEDYTSSSLVKRDLSRCDANFSHCRLSNNPGMNPFSSHCGIQCSSSNSLFNTIQRQRYEKLLANCSFEAPRVIRTASIYEDEADKLDNLIGTLKRRYRRFGYMKR